MDDDTGDDFFGSKLYVILFGMGSAALVAMIYHCIAAGWWRRCINIVRGRTSRQTQQDQQQQHVSGHEMLEIKSLENSKAKLIPTHKYKKGTALVVDDGMCSVCLSQFEEDEELKTLPGCSHSYHALCIDMWLYSHSSCPVCRTNATKPPETPHRSSDSGSVSLDMGMFHQSLRCESLN
ncbi:hypothetical protein V6N13_091961 [Hibiscus sabdariffa]|uniref:RING-type E3 ubiquitin transferase n=1 Tax=Hibiscus sabdariffa TaxID=183260 RepID=A0ABR2QG11_9ROSI